MLDTLNEKIIHQQWIDFLLTENKNFKIAIPGYYDWRFPSEAEYW